MQYLIILNIDQIMYSFKCLISFYEKKNENTKETKNKYLRL